MPRTAAGGLVAVALAGAGLAGTAGPASAASAGDILQAAAQRGVLIAANEYHLMVQDKAKHLADAVVNAYCAS